MQQLIEQQKFNLTLKSEQIQCPWHKHPINAININSNVRLGERLCCKQCSTIGQQVISLQQAETSLIDLLQQENQAFEIERETIIEQVNRAKAFMNQIQKQSFHSNEQIKSQSTLTQISRDIQAETIGASSLQYLAAFLSKQKIQNGKFQLQNTIGQPNQMQKKLEQLMNEFTSKLTSLRSELMIAQENIQIESRNYQYKEPLQLLGHSKSITALTISNDEYLMASGGLDFKIILWDFDEKSQKFQFQAKNQIQKLQFSSDNRRLAAAINEDILIFNLTQLKSFGPQITLKGHSNTIQSILFTQNSKFMISGSQDKTLKIWSLEDYKWIVSKNLQTRVYGVSISQNEKFIASCGGNGQVVLYNSSKIESPVELVKWKAHGFVNCAIFTQDCKSVLTCQTKIKLWSIDQLQNIKNIKKTPLKVFKGHDLINLMNLRINNTILVSVDVQIRFWNMRTGKELKTLQIPDGCINFFNRNLIVSHDMQCIVVGGQNGMLQVFELTSI